MMKDAELSVDPVVTQYWEQQRNYYLKPAYKYVFSPEANLEKYGEYKRNKKGLLAGASTALFSSICEIAAGLIDMGLENAAVAKKFAETALEVGDLGQYGPEPYPPVEFGMYQNLDHLHQANWILTGQKDANLRKALVYLTSIGDKYNLPRKKMSFEYRWEETWGCVVPYIIGGDIAQARYRFQQIHGDLNLDINEIAINGKDFFKTIYVLLEYLNNKDDKSKDIATRTIEIFYYNISGWGHVGTKPRDRLWNDLMTEGNFKIARIRADYFTGEKDPIKIIQSIRGPYL